MGFFKFNQSTCLKSLSRIAGVEFWSSCGAGSKTLLLPRWNLIVNARHALIRPVKYSWAWSRELLAGLDILIIWRLWFFLEFLFFRNLEFLFFRKKYYGGLTFKMYFVVNFYCVSNSNQWCYVPYRLQYFLFFVLFFFLNLLSLCKIFLNWNTPNYFPLKVNHCHTFVKYHPCGQTNKEEETGPLIRLTPKLVLPNYSIAHLFLSENQSKHQTLVN